MPFPEFSSLYEILIEVESENSLIQEERKNGPI